MSNRPFHTVTSRADQAHSAVTGVMSYRLPLMTALALLMCYDEKDKARDTLSNNGNGFISVFKHTVSLEDHFY